MVDFNKYLKKEREAPRGVLVEKPEEKEENPEQVEQEKAEAIRLADLPLISVLPTEQFKQAKELLVELETISDTEEHLKKRTKEIQEKLDDMQKGSELQGFRWGSLAYAAKPMQGKSKLDKAKLILLGVKAEIIAKATTRGKPYVMHIFEDLEKPKGKKRTDYE